MTKLIITMITFLFTSNINAEILYKIPLKSENNIVINNNLPNNDNSIGESAIDENPNSEEGINEWAVFLQNNSNYYREGFFSPMMEPANKFANQQEYEGEFCENEIECNFPLPRQATLEEIIEALKTSDAYIEVGELYSVFEDENEILVFPTENGLNNTIRELRLGSNVKEITGMSNVQVIKNEFEVINSKTVSYENLSNLKKIGGGLYIVDNLGNNGAIDMSFLRNLQEVEYISLFNKQPFNISKINKNLVMEYIQLNSIGYTLNEEDSYWIRDKIKNKTINKLFFGRLSNNDLKVLEDIEYIEAFGIDLYPNLDSLQGLNSILTIKYGMISGIDNLTNLEGLNNLTTVTEKLQIRYNENLVSTKGLESLTTAKILDFTFNNINDLTGLKNLVSVDRFLLGYNNLSNLDGLENLKEAGEILIGRNTVLNNINGLKNLEKIESLNFAGIKVFDISGLSGLKEVTGFITFNEIEGGFRVKLPRDSYLCKNTNKMRMYTFDGESWNINEVCE